jgi:hypothetical protein
MHIGRTRGGCGDGFDWSRYNAPTWSRSHEQERLLSSSNGTVRSGFRDQVGPRVNQVRALLQKTRTRRDRRENFGRLVPIDPKSASQLIKGTMPFQTM